MAAWPRRLPALAAVAVAVTALAGCGPQYRTFTNYVPPADEVGRQCVQRCLEGRRLCRREKDSTVQQCRIDAREVAEDRNQTLERDFLIDLTRHQAGILEAPPERPKAVQPDYGSCAREDASLEGQCGGDFDLCYQTCGGEVTYATHCVANCDG